MHYEQRWLDLVPGFFEDVHIVRDPSCNVAHWNLPDRRVAVREGAVLVDGLPCTVFRFSGYEPDSPSAVTKYSDRLTWENVGPARQVLDRFRRDLERAGYYTTRAWPYAYACFDNGVAVPDIARRMYLELNGSANAFGDPFLAGRDSYFAWLNEVVTDSIPGVRRIWAALYQSRTDLRRAFPDGLGSQSAALSDWIVSSGQTECGLSGAFLLSTLPLEQGELDNQATPEHRLNEWRTQPAE